MSLKIKFKRRKLNILKIFTTTSLYCLNLNKKFKAIRKIRNKRAEKFIKLLLKLINNKKDSK